MTAKFTNENMSLISTLTPHASMTIAVVDLGSNSFKVRISRHRGTSVEKIHGDKFAVRLIDGLSDRGAVSDDTAGRAIDAAKAIGAQLKEHDVQSVTVLATEAFRRLDPSSDLRQKLEAALGTAIEIVTGDEEARLCWQGVNVLLGDAEIPRIVFDVGGGSLQIMYGIDRHLKYAQSLPFGCVTWMRAHFSARLYRASDFERAVSDAVTRMREPISEFNLAGNAQLAGASGAYRAVLESVTNGKRSTGALTLADTLRYVAGLPEGTELTRVDFPSLSPERAEIMLGCLSLVIASFRATSTTECVVTKSGLRRGAEERLLGASQSLALLAS